MKTNHSDGYGILYNKKISKKSAGLPLALPEALKEGTKKERTAPLGV